MRNMLHTVALVKTGKSRCFHREARLSRSVATPDQYMLLFLKCCKGTPRYLEGVLLHGTPSYSEGAVAHAPCQTPQHLSQLTEAPLTSQ
ncbi:unnamed protein product, partial [Ixodes hexagonus]